ncbi:serine/arginine repetitive matrix protein 1-like [Bacillus rossius redtenbacheri]|uniref:serine/arginine repetitive matrix protein 1-like n=1 Tax=Bacillus rossius redtenbacheri TaxID=93214 RepID=UPI002FDCEFD7
MGNSSSQAQRPARGLHKVLPERAPGQRLRFTDNGAILHGGGTLSGRPHHLQGDADDFRARSSSTLQHRPPARDGPERLGAGGKRFGSEPDLRFLPGAREHDSPAKQRIARNQLRDKNAAKVLTKNLARKKYKAPAPPPEGDSPGRESSSPDSCQWDGGKDQPARRMRLFKTRAETRRSLLVQAPRPESYKPALPAPAPRRLSSPEFQEELLQAARRLRPTRRPEPPASREEGSGQESTPEPAPAKHWEILPPLSRRAREKDSPVKTFYFGMEQREQREQRVARAARQARPASSDSDAAEDEDGGGIALQLRPTLPKKQLEIPRFSPTAAWRLLSAQTAAPAAPAARPPRVERERPILPPPHSSLDKSGDSGISGDASPLAQDTWTPQQDLEESSSDGGEPPGRAHPFSPRAVFSLSLPRDDRLCNALFAGSGDESPQAPTREVPPSYSSLQKLRRSVSGFGRKEGERGAALDENWVLSRSVPNSLNTTHKLAPWDKDPSTSSPSTPDRPSFSYLASGGHVMYLPQLESRRDAPAHRERSYSASALLPRPHHDEMRQLGRSPSPPPPAGPPPPPPADDDERRAKGRRFTFQSTVRQIERRRLAERLSREAEQKERRRLGELEAMRRVEEEFQRKRAREKASIRQQLWLFSQHSSLPAGWGDARAEPDGAPSPSPSPQGPGPSTQVLSEFRETRREYRDYRQPRYVDSGPESLLQIDSRRATVHPKAVYDMPKSTQVYITQHAGDGPARASTPRSSTSDNYRRDFACGARPTGRSAASSDSEMSGHSQPPRQHQRARPASPALSLGCHKPQSNFENTSEFNVDPIVPVKAPRARIASLQPFARAQKSYRPIAFNPSGSPPNKVAQPVS